jgi:carbon storage regulator
MLVLSRKTNEVITIGDAIVIRVLETQRNRVKLGIEAPADYPIHRDSVEGAAGKSDTITTAS